jgi:hypothetical protein
MDWHLLLKDDEQTVGFDRSKILKASPSEIGIRFGFGAGIAVVAAVVGAVGLAAIAFTAALLLRWNPVVALLLALLAWAVVAGGLYFLFRESGLFIKQDQLMSKSR